MWAQWDSGERPPARPGKEDQPVLRPLRGWSLLIRRDRDPLRRAKRIRIREAAVGWHRVWQDRVDLGALAWEVAEMVDDVKVVDGRHGRATPERSWSGGPAAATTSCGRSVA